MDGEEKLVFPGERLCAEEEYIASNGTYVEQGNIYAAVGGVVAVHAGKMTVKSSSEQLIKLKRSNMALGTVVGELPSVLFIRLDKMTIDNSVYVPLKDGKIVIKQRNRGPPQRSGYREQREERHEEPKPCGLGDIVLACIADDESDAYELSLRERELGVVYSTCSDCGIALVPHKDGSLSCPNCKRKSFKKTSELYGKSEEITKFVAAHN